LYLKRLVLSGFKSFASRTRIKFDDGITAVVGPNGCGKSNIIDAFRWVLGEQSAKSLRGDKMHDVIFAGTDRRTSLEEAEVTLTFSNTERLIPVDYDEVELTRRVSRSSGSEYFLNGTRILLRDVQSLLCGSGMGKGSFSVFEQGKIDQIIFHSANDRRQIFEEVAGILRFKQTKKEVFSKLGKVEDNLSRARDIYREVDIHMKTLEKQVDKAQRYKKDKAEYETLEKSLLFDRWKKASSNYEELLRLHEEVLLKISAAEENAGAAQQERKEYVGEVASCEQKSREAQEQRVRAQGMREALAAERRSTEERIEEAGKKEKTLSDDIQDIHDNLSDNDKLLRDLKKTVESLSSRSENQDAKVVMLRDKLADAEGGIAAIRSEQKKAQAELLAAVEAANALERDHGNDLNALERCKDKREEVSAQQKALEKTITSLDEEIIEKQKIVDTTISNIDAKKQAVLAFDERLVAVEEDHAAALRERVQQRTSCAEVKARSAALIRLRDDMAGMSSDTQKIVKEAKKKDGAIASLVQPLYEYITPKKGYEGAVAAALAPYAQTLVVEKRSHREKVIAWAQKKKLSSFSLFCLEDCGESSSSGKNKGVSLSSCVEKSSLADHFLAASIYFDDVDAALKHMCAERTGDAVTGGGITVDSRCVVASSSTGESNVFSREAEVKTLEKEFIVLSKALEKKEMLIEGLLRTREHVRLQRQEADISLRKAEMTLVEVNMLLQRVKGDRKNCEHTKKRYREEFATVEHKEKGIRKGLAAYEKKVAGYRHDADACRKVLSRCDAGIDKHEKIMMTLRGEHHENNAILQKVQEEYREAAGAMRVAEVKRDEWKLQKKRREEEIHNAAMAQKTLAQRVKDLEGKCLDSERGLSEVSRLCEKLRLEIVHKRSELANKDKALRQHDIMMKKFEGQKNRHEVQMTREITQRENAEEALSERYQEDMLDLETEDIKLEVTQEEAEKRLQTLRRRLDNAGDVNLAAVDEYSQHQQRAEFLNDQVADLEGSQKELNKVILKLDKESRKAFKKTFEAVRENFRKNFAILFEGGSADLKLIESNDILEAGIDIIAQPPGKQMRSISLLSGGEKCLTAMALLFAIFEYKPAPFCLLDEIDAPLDDANVDRFTKLLAYFSASSQFIIISHNKRTMRCANALIGISMEERGVSKALSMHLSEEEESVEKREEVGMSV
jgi:chromosome segregation protein